MKNDVEDLARSTADVIAALDRGEQVTLVYRGRVIGTIVPVGQEEKGTLPIARHPAVGMWRDRCDLDDVDMHVRSLRRRRRLSALSDER